MKKLESFILGVDVSENLIKSSNKISKQTKETKEVKKEDNNDYKIIAQILSNSKLKPDLVLKNYTKISFDYKFCLYVKFLNLKNFVVQYNFKEFYTKQEILKKLNKTEFGLSITNLENELSDKQIVNSQRIEKNMKNITEESVITTEESSKELFVSNTDSFLVEYIFKHVIIEQKLKNIGIERKIFRVYKNLEKFDFINDIIQAKPKTETITEDDKIDNSILKSNESLINSSDNINRLIENYNSKIKPESNLKSKILLMIIKKLILLNNSEEYETFKIVYLLIKRYRLLDLSIFSYENFKKESENKSSESNFTFNCFNLKEDIINEETFFDNIFIFIDSDFFLLLVDLCVFLNLSAQSVKNLLADRNCWLNAKKTIEDLDFIVELVLFSQAKKFVETEKKYKLKKEQEFLKKDFLKNENQKFVDVNGYFDFLLVQNVSINYFEKTKNSLEDKISELENKIEELKQENEKYKQENTKSNLRLKKYDDVLIKELKNQIESQKNLKEQAEKKLINLKEEYTKS